MDAYPYKIDLEMFREQRKRFAGTMRSVYGAAAEKECMLLQGCSEIPRGHYSDVNFLFRQDSYFYYMFGLEMPDCFGALFSDGKGVIFIPNLPADYATWMGPLPTFESVKAQTGIDEVRWTDDIAAVLKEKGVSTVHVLHGTNPDSGVPVKTASFKGESDFKINKEWLHDALSYQRVIKTEREIKLLTWINSISSKAHIDVMQKCKPGMSQHQLESNFLHYIYYNGGMRQVSYTCICATGHHGATLHYPNNDKTAEGNTIGLLDMGGEYHCYASDITCSYPINARFTEDQKTIYNIVYDAQQRVMEAMKPGVKWLDMHHLALRTLAAGLIKNGILQNITVEDVMKKHLMKIFQPHGLGHLLGLEVHDVGGYPKDGEKRCMDPDSKCLRTCRVVEKGMFLTVEPGLYFNNVLLERALSTPGEREYLNEELVRRFWNFGGVRIEDDVIVTDDGIINLTCCPRTVEEIEATMAGKPFHKVPKVYNN